ncbi:PREDICTED: frataxin homolog, mitochondrial [Acromyrmex echinatior]|uniref:ferroxidase n=1 Tax=Acromyrmex echinatior TaxID=103372 RepID=F4X1Z8_ACREC|nr:PREDICTED: frataxin homolog, mitochondrial [Acromyrmex echinatior]EGI59534.1 Frataxin-like protein, mitochondrial [Acromyrmex echinatior]
MLTIMTRSYIIPRLSCSLFLPRISIKKRTTLQLNRPISIIAGYVNHNSIRFSKRNPRTLLQLSIKNFSITTKHLTESELSSVQYEKVCDETLDSLTEYFEELIEAVVHLPDADVSYGDGVLTVKFGEPYGTYVINRQTPNKQIWLSSPKSGPKRYDFVNSQWIYKHDGKTLHELLNHEISTIVKFEVCFDKCSFSGREKQVVMDNSKK